MRSRWVWVLAGLLAGAVLGVVAAAGGGSVARASLVLTEPGQDSLRVKQLGQTLERVVQSSGVVAAAAQARGIDAADLGRRVSAVWEQDTDVVVVSVEAAGGSAAVADANAVVDAAVQARRDGVGALLQQLQAEGDQALASGVLGDAGAEGARRSQLGSSLAARQDAAVASAAAVTVLERAAEAEPAGLPRSVGGVLGAAGGGLLAAALAMVVPVRRRRPRSLAQLRGLAPDLRVVPVEDVAGQLAGQLLESGRTCLAVVALPGTEKNAAALAAEVTDRLVAHGTRVAGVDTSGMTLVQRQAAVSRRGRTQALASRSAERLVLVTDADPEVLGLLAGQTTLLGVVLAKPRRSAVAEVRQVAEQLALAEPTIAVTR